MAGLTIHTRVYARDNLGRFLSHLEEAAIRTVRDTAERGAEVARAHAPARTGRLRSTIHAVQFTLTEWAITVGTDYWRYQEGGTVPHDITGQVRFYWEREARWWNPGANTIRHPGNPPVHFMAMAHEFIRTYFMRAARKNFA